MNQHETQPEPERPFWTPQDLLIVFRSMVGIGLVVALIATLVNPDGMRSFWAFWESVKIEIEAWDDLLGAPSPTAAPHP